MEKARIAYIQEYDKLECNTCGMSFVLIAIIGDNAMLQESTYYCPYCGAKWKQLITSPPKEL